MTLYLIDTNVMITAANTYYALNQVKEFWDWLLYQAGSDNVKMPIEMVEEVLKGGAPDNGRSELQKTKAALLDTWLRSRDHRDIFHRDIFELREEVNAECYNEVFEKGYEVSEDTDMPEIGNDAFLIAYALADKDERCVVTNEKPNSHRLGKQTKKPRNKKIPNVCKNLGVRHCDPFDMTSDLGFSTSWNENDDV